MIAKPKAQTAIIVAILVGVARIAAADELPKATEPTPTPTSALERPAVGDGPPAPMVTINPLVLKGPLFYEVIGRPDLALRYRNRQAAKTLVRVGGGITLGVGLLGVIGEAAAASFTVLPCALSGSSNQPACASRSGSPVPVALLGLGAAMLIAPSFWSTDPLTETEKVDLLAVERKYPVLELADPVPVFRR